MIFGIGDAEQGGRIVRRRRGSARRGVALVREIDDRATNTSELPVRPEERDRPAGGG
jgi:hypothetical protein